MKERILSEIRRIAEQQGKAPGIGTFARETGIGDSEWKGVHWARWSDALKEAGFEANTIQQPHEDDFLLRKYCEAARHFEKAPTKPELRMYSKLEPGFPSYNTMQKHFGSMAGLRFYARRWAEGNESYRDVINLIPETRETSLDANDQPNSDGWVYLLKSGLHFKIGRGQDLERRVKQVSIALPEKLELVHSIKTDDPSGIEAYWHNRFKEKRLNGEWFKLTPSDVKSFKRRKFQ